jgi:cold shock CspA family protein
MEIEKGYTTGLVVIYDRLKHWGFIAPDSDVAEVFVHGSDINAERGEQYLVRGQKVVFRIEVNPRNGKLRAVNVMKLADPISEPALRALGARKTEGQREQ